MADQDSLQTQLRYTVEIGIKELYGCPKIVPKMPKVPYPYEVCKWQIGHKRWFLDTVKLDFKELFTDYQLFYTINLLLNKELLPI